MKNLVDEVNFFLTYSNFSDNTIRNYRYSLMSFSNEIAKITDTPLNELYIDKIYEVYDNTDTLIMYKPIDASLIDDYFNSKIHKGYSYLKGAKDAIGSFFNYLERNYDFPNIMKDIVFNVRSYKPKNRRVNILSNHDILKFFHYLVSYSQNTIRDSLLFILFLTTGCRSSEITNIKIKDIYFEDNQLFLPHTKHNKSNMIPLRSGITDSIKIYCLHNNLGPNDKLFDLNQDQIRRLFYGYLKKAELPKVTLHSLRHSFASTMVDADAQINNIQQILGHADVKTTKGYVQPNLSANKNIKIKENEELYRYFSRYFKL